MEFTLINQLQELLVNKKIKEAIKMLELNSKLFDSTMTDSKHRKYDLYRMAAFSNSVELFDFLIANEVVYQKDLDPWGVAHHCAFNNSIEILNVFIENGFDYDSKDERGKSPFYWSVLQKKFDISKILLKNGVNVNVRFQPEQNMSLMHHESKDGRMEGLSFLLENGADPNTKDNRFGEDSTPIHGACLFDRLKATELLIKHGANVNAKNFEGKTALDFAVQSKKKKCVEVIQKNGGLPGKTMT